MCNRVVCFAQTEEAKHQANKNTGSGESLGDKASHAGNVASNKVILKHDRLSEAALPVAVGVLQLALSQATETKHSAQKATEK